MRERMRFHSRCSAMVAVRRRFREELVFPLFAPRMTSNLTCYLRRSGKVAGASTAQTRGDGPPPPRPRRAPPPPPPAGGGEGEGRRATALRAGHVVGAGGPPLSLPLPSPS